MFNNPFKNFYRVSIYERTNDVVSSVKGRFEESAIISPRAEFVKNTVVYKTDDGFMSIFDDTIIEAYSNYRSVEVGTQFINVREGIIPLDKFLDYSSADEKSREAWMMWVDDFNNRNNREVKKLGRKKR